MFALPRPGLQWSVHGPKTDSSNAFTRHAQGFLLLAAVFFARVGVAFDGAPVQGRGFVLCSNLGAAGVLNRGNMIVPVE
jgi:hypothetical protein